MVSLGRRNFIFIDQKSLYAAEWAALVLETIIKKLVIVTMRCNLKTYIYYIIAEHYLLASIKDNCEFTTINYVNLL